MTTEIVPFDYAAEIERSADPGEYVVQTLERAKGWLVEALNNGDIDTIVELKSQAEAIRIYSMSKQLGRDAEVAAAEIVRRADRGIGVAVRRGQEAAEIASQATGRPAKEVGPTGPTSVPRSPTGFFASTKEMKDTYAMTDGVSDEQFEEALTAAKTEGNLSRANVVRKVAETAKPEKAKTPSRRPLTDAFRASVWDAIRAVERLERLADDDRFPKNAEQVAAGNRNDLIRAQDRLTAVIAKLPHNRED